MAAAAALVMLGAAAQAPAHVDRGVQAPRAKPATVSETFGVLERRSPAALSATAARTLRRLRTAAPGRSMALDAGRARRVGTREAAVYLVPAPTGVCVIHGRAGRCSTDLGALADHGVYVRITRTAHVRGHRVLRATYLYGAAPDPVVSVTAVGGGEVVGSRVHANGFAVHVPSLATNLFFNRLRGVPVQIHMP